MEKSTGVAYILWFFGCFGIHGLHRFYCGKWISGLIWLFTIGLFYIGWIVDIFLIPSIVNEANTLHIGDLDKIKVKTD